MFRVLIFFIGHHIADAADTPFPFWVYGCKKIILGIHPPEQPEALTAHSVAYVLVDCAVLADMQENRPVEAEELVQGKEHLFFEVLRPGHHSLRKFQEPPAILFRHGHGRGSCSVLVISRHSFVSPYQVTQSRRTRATDGIIPFRTVSVICRHVKELPL